MKIVRWAAAAATALMGLMNLPFVLDDGGAGLAKPVAALVSLLGVAGIVAAVGLVRETGWAVPAAVTVGVVNLAGGVLAMTQDWNGAPIGLTVSLVAAGLSAALLIPGRRPTAAPAG